MATNMDQDEREQAVLAALERLAGAIDGQGGSVRFAQIDFAAMLALRARRTLRRRLTIVLPAAAAVAACVALAIALMFHDASRPAQQAAVAIVSTAPSAAEPYLTSSGLTLPAAATWPDSPSETGVTGGLAVPPLPSLSSETDFLTIPSVGFPTMTERSDSNGAS